MAVTHNSRSIIMTADNDVVVGRFKVSEMYLSMAGATPGAAFVITETSGAIIGTGNLPAADGAFNLVTNPKWLDGIVAATLPANTTLITLTL